MGLGIYTVRQCACARQELNNKRTIIFCGQQCPATDSNVSAIKILFMIIAGYSCQLLTKTKNSMLHHAKDLMSIFPFIDDANIRHLSGALSVSDRFSPSTALFDRISPFMSISSYKSMPYCSATYLTATGGSSLSRGLTPSFLSSSLWRESHLCRVFTDTPAAMASCALVIAVIIFKLTSV